MWSQNGERHNPAGRFPTNLVLQHTASCKCIGTPTVRGSNPIGQRGGVQSVYGDFKRSEAFDYSTKGQETVAKWECATDCPTPCLDEQSRAGRPASDKVPVGGASRFFKQVQQG